MAKLLVAGGTGLIGSELVRQALAAGHNLTLICRRPPPFDRLRTIIADLADPSGLAARLPTERFDAVLYLAQADDHHAFPGNAGLAIALNIAAPLALCQWAVQTGCAQYIHASSGGICGAGRDPGSPITEAWPRQPTEALSFYLSTKARCEELLVAFRQNIQLDLLRYFFVYGLGQKNNFLFPRLAGKIRAGEPIELAQGRGPWLNPIHVSDAARLTLAAVGTRGEQITNVAGPQALCLLDVVKEMERQLGHRAVITAAQGESPVYVADTGRMQRRLGNARILLADGLRTSLAA